MVLFAVAMLLLAVGISAARTTLILRHSRAMRLEEQSELTTIARLRTHATTDWRFDHTLQSCQNPIPTEPEIIPHLMVIRSKR